MNYSKQIIKSPKHKLRLCEVNSPLYIEKVINDNKYLEKINSLKVNK